MGGLAAGIAHLRAGRWERAHAIAQADLTAEGSWLHGIVHLVEGDEGNARYWYARAGRAFPGLDAVEAELAALAAGRASDKRG